MAYGLKTFTNAGREILTPTGEAGVFYGTRTFTSQDPNQVERFTFDDVVGYNVFFHTVRSGNRVWSKGVDGNGRPYIEARGVPAPTFIPAWGPEAFYTVIGIFVR